MARRFRIQVLRDGRWVACGSLTFTLAAGLRMIDSGIYSDARLVEVSS